LSFSTFLNQLKTEILSKIITLPIFLFCIQCKYYGLSQKKIVVSAHRCHLRPRRRVVLVCFCMIITTMQWNCYEYEERWWAEQSCCWV